MSENLILIFEPAAPPLRDLVPLLTAFPRVVLQQDQPPDQIAVYDQDDHVFVRPYTADAMARERYFEDWLPTLVPERASGLSVIYRGIDLAKRVGLVITGAHPGWVDTNFGEVYTSEEFARRCAREPGWDWRQRPAGEVPPVERPPVFYVPGLAPT